MTFAACGSSACSTTCASLRALGGYTNDDDDDHTDDRHPVWRERIARVAALAARYPEGERYVDRYNTRVARLVIGDDPRAVALVGNTMLFAHAGFAVDFPADTKAFVLGRMVMFVLPGEVVGTAQLIDRRLAGDMKNDATSHTELVLSKHAALAITIVKTESSPAPGPIAKALAATHRTPRAGELAQLHPTQFDPTRPRPIWAR
jgi:hypothetical protein